MTEAIGVALAAALLGAGWRRLLGSEGYSRTLIVAVGVALAFLVAFYATQVWWHALVISGIITIGMTDGHIFDPWKPLVWRYGGVTALVALALVYLGHGGVWYAAVGFTAPLGYVVAKRLRYELWTGWGELYLGAIILGPLPLLRL